MANGTATATTPRRRRARGTGTQEGQGQTLSGYFRQLFARYPTWLDLKDNSQILQHWAAEHPGQAITDSVKGTMANIKTTLRKQLAKPGRAGGIGAPAQQPQSFGQPFTSYQAPGAMPGLPSVPAGCQLQFLPGATMGQGCKVEQTPQGLAIIFVPATGIAATV